MAKKKAHTRRIPELVLFALCDGVSRDPSTGKVSLYGIFDTIGSTEFPAETKITGYAKFTDGSGKHNLTLQFLDARGRVIKNGEREIAVDFENVPVELNIQVSPVVFPKAGQYQFRILIDGKPASEGYGVKLFKVESRRPASRS